MKRIKRLPTILGLLLVLGAIAGGVVLIKQGSNLFSRAAPEQTPGQIKITNVTDSSLTVSWLTPEATIGFVKYGADNSLNFTANDDRDQISGKTDEFAAHHVTVKNLNPTTTYSFKIGSDSKLFDNNGQPYQAKTAPAIRTAAPVNDVAYGTVVDQNNNPVSGAIIYFSLANANPASALTKSSGSWVVPLNLIRSADLTDWATYDKAASIEEIFVQAGSLGTATVVATTKNDSPMPKITLGQSFDFKEIAQEEQKIEEREAEQSQASPSGKFSLPTDATPSATASPTGELAIINPDEDENVNTQKPEFVGTGPVNKNIIITVESPQTYSATIKVNANGDWQWTPPANLEPGEHTVTISYTDDDGQLQKVSKTFMILAAGSSELPAMTASPSSSGTTPTPSPSLTPTPAISLTPTTTISATPTSTSSATDSSRTSMPSTTSGVPTSGYLTPTFMVFIMGLVLIFIGFFLRKSFDG